MNIKIDSRCVKEGDTFIAIRGINNDGHKYDKCDGELSEYLELYQHFSFWYICCRMWIVY